VQLGGQVFGDQLVIERLELFEIGADQRTRRISDREMPTDISG
jgi:hypothetical protein